MKFVDSLGQRRHIRRKSRFLTLCGASLLVVTLGPAVQPAGASDSGHGQHEKHEKAVDALVSVGSPVGIHPQNAQEESPLAVDPSRPNVLVSGANDLVDMQPCSQNASTTNGQCANPPSTYNQGVGTSAAYFSFDSGHSWIQPTNQGLTAAGCDATVEPCKARPGPIHTVPNFYEVGLRSRSDTAFAFGPVLSRGKFSWENGSRLYFATDATNLDDSTITVGAWSDNFAITVSHIDNVTPARIRNQRNWSSPHILPARPSIFSSPDKPQVWADNAASSPFFGNAYVCFDDFGTVDSVIHLAVSTDGGDTWVDRPTGLADPGPGWVDGCTVRTDSHGIVYLFITHFDAASHNRAHTLVKSFDGGNTWTTPVDVVPVTDICYAIEPIYGECIMDGIAGARLNLSAAPSVSTANGAPSGDDATNEIVDSWADGSLGQGAEKAVLTTSTNGGMTWSRASVLSLPGDRAMYAAPAISPDGKAVYVVYEAFVQPFQRTTASPRLMHGVMRRALIGDHGLPTRWTTVYNGPTGDARGSSQGRILAREFLGDYVYAIATNDYGAGVWSDVRRSADCPALDAWRQASDEAGKLVFPAPWPLKDCPPSFGNADIFSASTG